MSTRSREKTSDCATEGINNVTKLNYLILIGPVCKFCQMTFSRTDSILCHSSIEVQCLKKNCVKNFSLVKPNLRFYKRQISFYLYFFHRPF